MKRTLPLVVVLGATGAGKSKLALELAQRFSGEIISADSMQVYNGLDIVTNKVTREERQIVRHHLLDFVNPLHSNYTVVDFQKAALPIIDDILQRCKIPVIVGGTNYYIESLLWKFLMTPNNDVEPGENMQAAEEHSDSVNESMDSVHVAKKMGDQEEELHCQAQAEVYAEISTEVLHMRLSDIDVESALRIHPRDRRKIARALQVYEQHGESLSKLLSKQHEQQGDGAARGSLRYSDPCVIWVTCDQETLDQRTDRRVDKMIDEGLLNELNLFHADYKQHLLLSTTSSDAPKHLSSEPYVKGIFQSIGFKEFHSYLLLETEDRLTDKGQRLLHQGLQDMKRATRQYARRQLKWINNRFLRKRGGSIPPVYAVDSTEPSLWYDHVHEPASAILHAYLQGEVIGQAPLPVLPQENIPSYNVCEVCDGKVFVTSKDWLAHIYGRRHKKRLLSLKRKEAERIRTPTDLLQSDLSDSNQNAKHDT